MTGTSGSQAWSETFLLSISAQGGTDIPFQGITETIDFDGFEKDFEGIAMGGGGRIEKIMPEGDVTVTLEAYPIYVGNADISAATTGTGFFDLLHEEDTSEPYTISASRSRSRYRIAIMFTSDTGTNAADSIPSGSYGKRFVAAGGFITKVTPSFTDGILKYTITYKVTPFDSTGNANYAWQSVSGGAALATLSAYTSTIKGW